MLEYFWVPVFLGFLGSLLINSCLLTILIYTANQYLSEKTRQLRRESEKDT